jgi:hypothetical protein
MSAWNTPARNLDDADLVAELNDVERQWDEYFTDPEFEGHGGSPGEWMAERMDELRTEIVRRNEAALNSGEPK